MVIRKAAMLLLVLVVGMVPGWADDLSAARTAYKTASQHFKLGEYEPALDSFKEAYRLREDPTFLFNIGQCHRMLGQRTEAIAAFRAYLNDAKRAPNRADVEAVIAKLREEVAAADEEKQRQDTAAAVAAAAAAQPAPPVATVAVVTEPPPPRKTPVYKKWWLWTTVGAVVVVGLGVGLGVGLTRSSYPHASSTDGSFHF